MIDAYVRKAQGAARRAALSVFACVLMLVGVIFLGVAAWLVLVELRDPTFAALVMGGVFVGLGLVVLGITSMLKPRVPVAAPPPTNAVTLAALIEAFTLGLGAARSRGRRDT
ncbi:hypothetical protein [Anianabacter salinae]|uniref:hypothetical protein n=1 Tax=Anianabacter salinae TaxID=2851023 RepID=UPI00225E65A3|nr:hypothetical protein [Anianabacter salinae]MBV0912051.1 hypothetical protein [Anianabacter salinae]